MADLGQRARGSSCMADRFRYEPLGQLCDDNVRPDIQQGVTSSQLLSWALPLTLSVFCRARKLQSSSKQVEMACTLEMRE